MAYKVVALFLFALAMVQHSVCRPDGAAAPSDNKLQDLLKDLQDAGSRIVSSLQSNLPDSATLTKAITDNTQSLAANIEDIGKRLKAKVDENKGTTDEALNRLTSQINEAVASIRQAVGPDASSKADELKAKVGENIDKVVGDLKQLGENVKPDLERTNANLQNFAKQAFSDVSTALQQFGDKIQQSIATEKPK